MRPHSTGSYSNPHSKYYFCPDTVQHHPEIENTSYIILSTRRGILYHKYIQRSTRNRWHASQASPGYQSDGFAFQRSVILFCYEHNSLRTGGQVTWIQHLAPRARARILSLFSVQERLGGNCESNVRLGREALTRERWFRHRSGVEGSTVDKSPVHPQGTDRHDNH
jgi:hypothetical protein